MTLTKTVLTCDNEDCLPGGERRRQLIRPAGVPGGVTPKEAQTVGWRRSAGKNWLCPFCSGNTDALKKVFDKSRGR